MKEIGVIDSQQLLRPDTILKLTLDKVTGAESDIPLIMESLHALIDVDVISDLDQRDWLYAKVMLIAHLFSKFAKSDEAMSLLEESTEATTMLAAILDPDSIFCKAKQAIYDLQTGIVKGDTGNPGQKAIQTIIALPYQDTKFDGDILVQSIVQIRAMNEAAEFLKLYDEKKVEAGSDAIPLVTLWESLLDKGFGKKLVLDTYSAIEKDHERFQQKKDSFDFLLFAVYGIGLIVKPDASPALESLQERLILRHGFTATQFLSPKQNNTALANQDGTAIQIITAFMEMVTRDGFSEYAFQNAIVELKKLPVDTDEGYKYFNEAIDDFMETAKLYAPLNYQEPIEITRVGLKEMAAIAMNPPRKLNALGFKKLAEDNLRKLKKDLAHGRSVEGAFSQYMMSYNKLCVQIPESIEGNEEILNALIKSLIVDGFQALKDYIPENKKELWPQLNAQIQMVGDAVEMSSKSEAEQNIYLQRMDHQTERTLYTAKNMPISPWAQEVPTIRQFVELFIPFADRFIELSFETESEDQKEYKRLTSQLDDTLSLLKSAYTLKQLMEHQKMNLRRMALELGQFERREFLMVANPIFPSNEVGFDANCIFYSGLGKVGDKVAQACLDLEMTLSSKKGTDNFVNTRWQQLRESGIAIFDYTGYNPKMADPKGELDTTPEVETKVLKAAGAIADVAYENGLAFVLGKPSIVIMQKAKSMPFDIDLDPVVLTNSEQDILNIEFAIQSAIYGVTRGMKGSCLKETINYVKTEFQGNKKVISVMSALENSSDATCIRLAIESALDRMDDTNRLLVIPSFPGSYPKSDEKLVFHVTAFRPWSKFAESTLKEACNRKKLEYKIGYERLNQNIMASIFKDISQSAFVVADITNLNPNAVLELAIAQALGRPTLIITQNKNKYQNFKSIQKARIHRYSVDANSHELARLFEDFFNGKE